MPDRLRRRPAAAVGTVSIALAVALGVAAAGYGAQRLLLRTPPRAELVAAHAVAELPRFRYSRSVVHIAGARPRRAECLEGWETIRHNGRQLIGHGAQVLFSDGERLRVGLHRIVVVTPGRDRSLLPPIAELELAGCGRILANHVYANLVGGRRTYAVRELLGRRDVYRIHVRTRRMHVDMFVDAKTLRVVAIHLETRYATAFSHVRQVRLTPALKQSFARRFLVHG